jgi:DNA replication protein DnaT
MRIRTVKPEFWVHPVMSRLAYDTRILALGLLNLADDEGYFDADPDYIRGAVLFREDSSNVRRMLDELSRSEWIDLCGSPDRPIGRVTNFRKHQRVDRPQPSRLKQYALVESSTNDRRVLVDQSTQDQGTGKGRDTPIVPASGDEAPPAPPAEDPSLLRAKAIFRMRPGTPLDRTQARAWKTNRAAVAATHRRRVARSSSPTTPAT